MNYFCLQLTQQDCGLACLKMLLAYSFHNSEYLYLKQDLNHGSYSFQELKQLALEHGLTLEGVEVNDFSLLPNQLFIALINKENQHYILVKKITKKQVIYLDPDSGEVEISKEEFFKDVSPYFLIVKDKKKLASPKKTPFPYFIKERLLLLFFTFIQLISIFLFSFYDKNVNYQQILGLVLFLLSYLGVQFTRIRYLKEFDKKIINPFYQMNEEDIKTLEQIENAFLLKKDYFLWISSHWNSVIIFAFCSFILIINDLKHLAGLFIFVILFFSCYHIVQRKSLLLGSKVKRLEKERKLSSYQKANELSYHFAKNRYIFDAVLWFYILCYILLSCLLNNDFSTLLILLFLFKIIKDQLYQIVDLLSLKQNVSKEIQIYQCFMDSATQKRVDNLENK